VAHTGELELALEADSEEGVFEQGFEAMRELLEAGGGEVAPARTIELEAGDRAALLADWLAELAFVAESEGLVPERLEGLELEDSRLRAIVRGRTGSPPHLVKAATYHRLSLEQTERGWHATVILDV
jgi:SHS2 domain-containing protein